MADLTLHEMEALIRTYFDGCNEADREKMMACFTPEAVHYFPQSAWGGPFVGAAAIADRWVSAVETLGSAWTVDRFVGDAERGEAVIEWTHYKQYTGALLRGAEWYCFDRATGLITEIRAYYASPVDASIDRLELAEFDYAERGYPLTPPADHIRRGQ